MLILKWSFRPVSDRIIWAATVSTTTYWIRINTISWRTVTSFTTRRRSTSSRTSRSRPTSRTTTAARPARPATGCPSPGGVRPRPRRPSWRWPTTTNRPADSEWVPRPHNRPIASRAFFFVFWTEPTQLVFIYAIMFFFLRLWPTFWIKKVLRSLHDCQFSGG